MDPLKQWLKILMVNRGYWGTDLFCELKQDYGIDFVSPVRDEKREINQVIQQEIGQPNGSGVSNGQSGSSPGENRSGRY